MLEGKSTRAGCCVGVGVSDKRALLIARRRRKPVGAEHPPPSILSSHLLDKNRPRQEFCSQIAVLLNGLVHLVEAGAFRIHCGLVSGGGLSRSILEKFGHLGVGWFVEV